MDDQNPPVDMGRMDEEVTASRRTKRASCWDKHALPVAVAKRAHTVGRRVCEQVFGVKSPQLTNMVTMSRPQGAI